jgi:hypothetical protein
MGGRAVFVVLPLDDDAACPPDETVDTVQVIASRQTPVLAATAASSAATQFRT